MMNSKEMRHLFAWLSLTVSGGVFVYELLWWGRSGLAKVLVFLAAAVALGALGNLIRDEAPAKVT